MASRSRHSPAGDLADGQAGGGLAKALPLQAKLLEIVPAGVYTCDPDGLVTYVNRRAVEIWGREPALNDPQDRFCGSFRLFSADGSPISHEECWMALALREERPYENREIIIERPNGDRVTVLAHAHPFHYESGELAGAVNVLVDITERKAAEKAKARLAAIVDSADDAIVGKDLDGVIRSWNSGAEQIFGYTAEEAIGQHVTLIFPPELEDEEDYILERLRRGEMIDHYETVRCRKDGKRLDISVTISPIRDSRGRIVGASKIARDITERKRREEALRQADRRKDEFLAMLSHELRNPLAPIRNAVEILWGADAADDPPRHRALGALDRQVETLTRLVDELLDVTRVTTGTIELQREEVELNGIVRDAVETVRPQMDERRHRLTLSLAREPLWVHGDATRLEQVIVNLLTNAAKYTPEEGHVSVTVDREADTGRDRNGSGRAALRVEDDGVGMEPELLSRVFELFGQGESTPDRADGGLGVGLSLVKTLVEMHEGTVEAASEGRGEGSAFTVRLPLLPLAEDEKPGASRMDEPALTEAAETAPLRVLVVDDHPDTVEMLTTLIRWKDHEVRTAADGLEALRVADEFDPDVVFLDIGLPELDGYEVARRLRGARGSTPPFVLVALTGYGLEDDRRRAMEAGFDHHLVKPTDFDELQGVLEKVGEGTPAG